MPLLLPLLALLLSLVALAVDSAHLWQARQELQSCADAAALAAVQGLVHDGLLCPAPGRMAELVAAARGHAQHLARLNPSAGHPLELQANELQDPLGDIVFGFFEPATGQFLPARPEEIDWPMLNAVRVMARRSQERGNAVPLFFGAWIRRAGADVAGEALAILDRDIVGLRAVPRTTIPMMPLALLSDPAAKEELSWEVQIEQHLCLPHRELPRMLVHLPLDADEGNKSNGFWLRLGTAELAGWVRQIHFGLSATDLQAWDGALVPPENGTLSVPAEPFLPASSRAELRDLHQALLTLSLSEQPRIWPLYAQVGKGEDGGLAVGLSRFVAAKLEALELHLSERQLTLVLRPCQIVTTTALARSQAEPADSFTPNPYIAKARLVK
jgi:hypothetical protein